MKLTREALITHSESLRYFDLPIKPLAKFEGNLKLTVQTGILFDQTAYLELVDMTGRIQREDKRGVINAALPAILDRLNLDIEAWLIRTQSFEEQYQELFAKHRLRKNKAA